MFGQVCKNCHETGLAGAPKFGDKAQWAHVIAEGEKVVSRIVLVGTQEGPFRIMRQQPVRIPCVDSVRVHEHKAVELWGTLLRPDVLQTNRYRITC